MRAEQTVHEMAEEILLRQARALARRIGQPLCAALEAVLEIPAGMQLVQLRSSPHQARGRSTGRLICCLSV